MSNAPWWGAPVLAGIFLVAGAIIAQGVNVWQERRRSKREDQRRWDKNLLEACATFGRLAREHEDGVQWGHVVDDSGPYAYPLRRAHAELELLASQEVADVAASVLTKATELQSCIPSSEDVGAFAQYRRHYINAVRKELGRPELPE